MMGTIPDRLGGHLPGKWHEVRPAAFGARQGRSFCRPAGCVLWQVDGIWLGMSLRGIGALDRVDRVQLVLGRGDPSWRTFTDRAAAWQWLGLPAGIADELDALLDICHGRRDLMVATEAAVAQAPQADLATVARQVGISSRSLQRALNKSGVTFNALRTRIRLERARTLLAQPQMKNETVAREIGFDSTGHFIVWFRRHLGITPGAHRAKLSGPTVAE